MKTLGHSKNTSGNGKIGLNLDNSDEICFDNVKVADHFNGFFTSIASKLVNLLPPPLGLFNLDKVRDFYSDQGVTTDSFQLKPVDEEFIHKKLLKIDVSKSTGLDKLPARFVRDSADIITPPFTHIMNLSITTAVVPKEFKKAKVIPLHKKNSRQDAGNFRPVSILPILSKIMERTIYEQLESYLRANDLLYELQSGFRSSFSTDTCLIHLTDYIKREMDLGNFTGMVLLDLQKAFDTVDHDILCSKLTSIGLDELSVEWFRSYLTQRSQTVYVNGTFSSDNSITCGVPQGSLKAAYWVPCCF